MILDHLSAGMSCQPRRRAKLSVRRPADWGAYPRPAWVFRGGLHGFRLRGWRQFWRDGRGKDEERAVLKRASQQRLSSGVCPSPGGGRLRNPRRGSERPRMTRRSRVCAGEGNRRQREEPRMGPGEAGALRSPREVDGSGPRRQGGRPSRGGEAARPSVRMDPGVEAGRKRVPEQWEAEARDRALMTEMSCPFLGHRY